MYCGLLSLDKMASEFEAARPEQQRRLRAEGVLSYTNAPNRWSVWSLRICEETGHGEI